ncbi:L,D-transpeptidase [Mycolicibacterium pallens]|uniref:L,D-transpeptidase family protein n=1 Tax=Mycolicibacterium pallens TaxID=370524 RepID=A0ABX8VJ45_9MYCO|nr:Ig-like domain-containing protein [Mycolicibacterium pallens]QYL17834.1 L,D-transpeptidase family protein [Mycolicibacterium pallens]
MTLSRRARGACLGVVLAVLAVLGGVVVSSAPRCPEHCRTEAAALTPQPAPSKDPAAVALTPADGATDVDPLGGISVVAKTGVLTRVTMVNDADKPIPGIVTPDFKTWKPTVPLGYGRSYTLTVDARGPGGVPSTMSSTFQTLVPSDQTQVTFTTPGWQLLDGARMGIGTVVVAHFGEPISDRAAAERHLSVTTNPPVQGSWYWMDDQTAHWRPEKYYAPGTSVTVRANVYGVPLGDGLYGEQDSSATFTIGDAHVSVADDTTKQVSVFDNGKLVRTMPTSMGRGGSETIGGQTLTFWTPPGVYTVMDKANPVIMDSSTYGLPINSRLGYRETIPYATRISPDGIYLHQLNATVWAQGNTNVSHGCLNLSGENAAWFYDFSVPGDVVEVKNTGGPPLQLTQNGDWTLPWSEWLKGSALH